MRFDIGITTELLDGIRVALTHSVWQVCLLGLVFELGRRAIQRFWKWDAQNAIYVLGCVCLTLAPVLAIVTFCNIETMTAATRMSPAEALSASLDSGDSFVVDSEIDEADSVSEPYLISESVAAEPPQRVVHSLWIVGGWMLGVFLVSIRLWLGVWHVRRLGRIGLVELPGEFVQIGNRLAKRLGIRTKVRFAASSLLDVPAVAGLIKPVVLLPTSMVSGLTAHEVEQIFAHELAHVRRLDFVINLLQLVVESLFFFHPVVWWISRELRVHRENCCDDAAIQSTGDPVQYAKTLARLESLRIDPSLLAANGASLSNRIKRILGQGSHHQSEGVTSMFALVVTLIVLSVVFGSGSKSSFGATDQGETKEPRDITEKATGVDQSGGWSKLVKLWPSQVQRKQVSEESNIEYRKQLILAAATREGITVSGEEIENAIEGKVAKFGDIPIDREMIKFELLLRSIAKRRVVESDSEIRKAYEDQYGRRAKVLAIFCDNQRLAIQIWEALQSNGSRDYFKRMAKEYSVEPVSRTNSGRIAPLKRFESHPAISTEAFELKKGEVSNLIQVGEQFVILYGDGYWEPESRPDWKSARIKLAKQVREKLIRQEMVRELKRLEASANDDFGSVIEEDNDHLILAKTYAVADLVVPMSESLDVQVFDGQVWKATFHQPPRNEVDGEELIQLIKSTISPDDWGRSAEVQFYKPTVSLIVSQTSAAHDEIQDLLEKLRELSASTIGVKAALVIVPKSEVGNFNVSLDHGVASISNRKAKYLRSLAKAKENVRVIEFPTWNCFNGQELMFELQNLDEFQDLKLRMQQLLAPDGSSVSGVLAANQRGREKQSVLIAKPGQSAMVDLSEMLQSPGDCQMWMIWTPTVTRDSIGL